MPERFKTCIQENTPLAVEYLSHQKELLERKPERHLLAYDTGTGKTLCAIGLCNTHQVGSVLVIVKLDNFEQWIGELGKFINTGTKFTVMTKEFFRDNVQMIEQYDAVIVDEAHHFAGMKSTMSKRLFWYMNKYDIKYRYLATATPYCSTPWNIYTIAQHLGHKWNYQSFKIKFYHDIKMGIRSVPALRPGMEGEVAKLVDIIGSSIDITKAAVVPEQRDHLEQISLTDEQTFEIKEFFDPVFIVRWTRQHQIENGIIYGDDIPTRYLTCNKTKRVLELAKQHKKIIFVARYTAQLEMYRDILEKSGRTVYVLSGKTKNRREIVVAAENSEDCVFLMQASCSAGFELPSFRVMVFTSMSFSYVDYKQARGRILRINKLAENDYIHLVSDGVDRDVYNAISRGQDFTYAIYNYENDLQNR